jgi:stringent starvation protein B
MTASTNLEKRDRMLELLDRGLVMVHLDPRCEGVLVPEWFKDDPTLRLNIAYGFNLPSLDIDEEGVYAVLSFGGQNHGCMLPWSAVFAITLPQDQHDGQVWPSSLPKELLETMAAVEAGAEEIGSPPSGPRLRVVKSEDDEGEPVIEQIVEDVTTLAPEAAPASVAETPTEHGEPASAPGRAKLRLVTD